MRARYLISLVIAATVAFSSIGASSSSENDGGSGGDAGDLLSDALSLSSLTDVTGYLSAIDDRDWYYHNATDSTTPVCLESKMSSDYPTSYRASLVDAKDAREVTSKVGGRNGISGPGHAGGFLEVWGPQLELPPLRSYKYTSQLKVLASDRPAWNDGDSGTDASASEPVAITKGCIQGALKGAWGDNADVYTFTGNANSSIMLSLAGYSEKINLTLKAPDGSTVESIAYNALEQVILPQTGTYTMTASTDHSGLLSYSIGLCEPDCTPPPHPCRPACIAMVAD